MRDAIESWLRSPFSLEKHCGWDVCEFVPSWNQRYCSRCGGSVKNFQRSISQGTSSLGVPEEETSLANDHRFRQGLLQLLSSGGGNEGLGEGEPFEVAQLSQLQQSLIGDLVAAETQVGKTPQSFERGQPFVGHASVTKSKVVEANQ